MSLPFQGGRVRFPDGDTRYPNGKHAWRCSWCGKVGPWQEGWGGYWSYRDEDDGLYADHGRGYPVWCSPECGAQVSASGACSELQQPTVTRRKRK
jgi:hypothetical protein